MSAIVEIDGREVLIPTLWDGQVVDTETAIKNAINSGVAWDSAEPTDEGRALLQKKDDIYHMNFDPSTTPEEARAELANKTNQGFALGGLATANKGITTKEGEEMAKEKTQLDRKKADKNGDGKLSKYEEVTGEAIQKAIKDDELIEMSHGGMACDGMMSDPYSGNDIPMGSSAENVRDDIEVMISEGEYVLPANVVKWHGLKYIMGMQSEAEMGLMSMYDTGLIQYTDEEDASEPEEVEAQDDTPEEEIEVEVAAVKVDDKLDDDEEVEESYPRTSNLPGVMQKKNFAFIS